MSQFADITKVFKNKVKDNVLDIVTATEMFVEVIEALEWDFEDYMDNVPSRDDYAKYQKLEHEIACKLLLEII